MGWEGGVVVFCVVCGKYWGSLKMMILFWGGFVFRLPCGFGGGWARGKRVMRWQGFCAGVRRRRGVV